MIHSPPARPAAETPDGARGCEAELRIKLQASDGRGIRRITEAEAAQMITHGLGYWRRPGEIWLIDQASPSSRTRGTWSGKAERPSTLRHNHVVCKRDRGVVTEIKAARKKLIGPRLSGLCSCWAVLFKFTKQKAAKGLSPGGLFHFSKGISNENSHPESNSIGCGGASPASYQHQKILARNRLCRSGGGHQP